MLLAWHVLSCKYDLGSLFYHATAVAVVLSCCLWLCEVIQPTGFMCLLLAIVLVRLAKEDKPLLYLVAMLISVVWRGMEANAANLDLRTINTPEFYTS